MQMLPLLPLRRDAAPELDAEEPRSECLALQPMPTEPNEGVSNIEEEKGHELKLLQIHKGVKEKACVDPGRPFAVMCGVPLLIRAFGWTLCEKRSAAELFRDFPEHLAAAQLRRTPKVLKWQLQALGFKKLFPDESSQNSFWCAPDLECLAALHCSRLLADLACSVPCWVLLDTRSMADLERCCSLIETGDTVQVAQVMDEEGFHEVPVPVSPESYGGFRVKATKKCSMGHQPAMKYVFEGRKPIWLPVSAKMGDLKTGIKQVWVGKWSDSPIQ
mmetsp:Transcript_38860/g.92916  ORF Transcript_38860/g.92916 Transcript_38860/m.92916 type:complete len:274 (+) Transcript_38860:46-867(+)